MFGHWNAIKGIAEIKLNGDYTDQDKPEEGKQVEIQATNAGRGFSISNQLFIPVTREGKAFLVKTDLNGKTIWEKEIGSGEATRAKQDSKGNIYFISGTFETGSRISKLDKDGNILWSTKPNTSGGDWYTDLEVLGSNVYAVGGTTQAGRFNAARRAKVLNLDTSGQQIFSKTYDIEGAGSFRSVTTDGKDLYVSASPYGRRDFDSAIAAKLDGSNIARVIWQNRIGGDWNSEADGTIFGDYFVSNGYKADGGDRQDNRIIYRDIKTGKVIQDKS